MFLRLVAEQGEPPTKQRKLNSRPNNSASRPVLQAHRVGIVPTTTSTTPFPNGNPNVPSVNEMGPQPQAGGGVAGGTGSSQVPVVTHERHNPSGTLSMCKTFQIYSAGYQMSVQPFTFVTNIVNWNNWLVDANSTIITTPLSVIDPNALPWYMTETEWNNLPVGTTAIRANIKLTPLGYRLPFATNEATSSYANSQTLVQVSTAVGINTAINGLVSGYDTSTDDLTKVTAQKSNSFSTLTAMLYGDANNIGCNVGIPRHNNNYYTLITNKSNRTPNLIPYLEISNVNDVKGTTLVDFNYEFREGLLKAPSTTQFAQIKDGAAIWEGKNPQLWGSRVGGTTTRADNSNRLLELRGSRSTRTMPFAYNTIIDKAPYMSRFYNQVHSPEYPPLLAFGVMPVQSNAALATTVSFADVVVQWQVETCLEMSYQLNFVSPLLDVFYLNAYDPVFGMGFDTSQMAANTNSLKLQNRHTYSLPSGIGGTLSMPNQGPFKPPPTTLAAHVEEKTTTTTGRKKRSLF